MSEDLDIASISSIVIELAEKNKNNIDEFKETISLLNKEKYWAIKDDLSNYGYIPKTKSKIYLDKLLPLYLTEKRILVDYYDNLIQKSDSFRAQIIEFLGNNKIRNEIKIFLTWGLNQNFEEEDINLLKKSIKESKSEKLRKTQLWAILNSNPSKYSNYFANFIVSVDNPFYYLGGAIKSQIGIHVNEALFNKVSLHLLDKFTNSRDFWFDIQQIGRWVGEDFVVINSNLSKEKEIEQMVEKMMIYFEEKYENADNKP